MIRNYIKLAWRNLIQNKGYSLINIGGLAIGMTVAMLIGLWVYDELAFNQYHENYDRIALVLQNQTFNGEVETSGTLVMPLGNELRHRHPNSKSANIDKGVAFILNKISPGKFYVISNHANF